MTFDLLTRDNPHLSRPTNGGDEAMSEGVTGPADDAISAPKFAIDCTNILVARVTQTGGTVFSV